MRLINTQTLELEEFFGDDIPRYAIISHTWTRNQEITFQEWTANCRLLSQMNQPRKKGYDKIESACRVARNSRLKHLWVDTNCIDKSSSAELSEAINSMFSWYNKSAVCFAYLEDVSVDGPRSRRHGEERYYLDRSFEESKWFTRGWTLQELIAPRNLVFYSREWIPLGTKYDLHSRIELRTGIPREFIGGNLRGASNAQIMSWASTRSTTRSEDIAYCLLGLFKINMPLLYGEGKQAFYRLQEEIIRRYNDHSLFCW
ncbi:heterokaryon incompatibility protein-domain-containing protein, partial [Bisporella sp. PMI_857]